MEWMPIETAPKDGTDILIFEPCSDLCQYNIIYVVHYSDKSWVESAGEMYSVFYPTHWMPLPEPPKE